MLSRSRVAPYKAKATSILFSHKTKLISTCLAVTIVVISIALIAYTAASLQWVNHYRQHGEGVIAIVEHNYSQYTYHINATWGNEFYYNAAALNMADTWSLLAAGILGGIMGLVLLAIPFRLGERRLGELDLPGRGQTRSFDVTTSRLTTILDLFLAIVFLTVAVAVGVRVENAPYAETYSLPDHHIDRIANLGPSPRTPFENWNCDLLWNTILPRSSPSRDEIQNQCTHATRSRHLSVALAVLVLVRLTLRPMGVACMWVWQPIAEFHAWRKHTREMREGKGTELDEVKGRRASDLEEGKAARDSVQEDGSTEGFIAELPGWRMSRAEMDEDAAVTEMPGAEGGKEMDAGIAAVEKDGVEKDRSGKS